MRNYLAAELACAIALACAAPAIAAPGRVKSDPMFEQQWGLIKVKAPQAWARSTGRGVVVAVIDTGVDLTHPDLKGKLVRGVNLVDPSKPPQDDHGHGTHVAGIIAAATRNGRGISAVAPDAKIMPVKVLDKSGGGTTEAIAKGIRYAADHGADVINMSLAEEAVIGNVSTLLGENDEMHAAIDHAWRKGVVIVVAAGNSTVPLCSEPAAADNTICVGAVGPDDTRAYYSQGDATNMKSFVSAPGGAAVTASPDGVGIGGDDPSVNILSTVGRGTGMDRNKTGYASAAGTSMAAPHVAGVAALLLAQRRSPSEVVKRILETAKDLGVPGRDPVYGYGLVDAATAVAR